MQPVPFSVVKWRHQQRFISGELKDHTSDFCIIYHSYTFISALPISVVNYAFYRSYRQLFSWLCCPAMDCLKPDDASNLTLGDWLGGKSSPKQLLLDVGSKRTAMNLASWREGLKKMNTNLNGDHIKTANQAAAVCKTRKHQSEANDNYRLHELVACSGPTR